MWPESHAFARLNRRICTKLRASTENGAADCVAPLRGHSGTPAQASNDSPSVIGFLGVVRFAGVRLVAVVVAVLILGATLAGAAALPWNPLQGLTHSCPPTAPRYECRYASRPAWVFPTALAIGLVGLAGASGVLAAIRRRRTPVRTSQPGRPL